MRAPRLVSHLSILAIVIHAYSSTADAQDVPLLTVGEPTHISRAGFLQVVAVRALGDGQLLLLDKGDNRIFHLSATLESSRQVGRVGSGPGEYRSPSRLLPLRADTTAVVDPQNNRILLLSPTGSPVGTRPLEDGLPCNSGAVQRHRTPVLATDLMGRQYALGAPIGETRRRVVITDSMAIERWISEKCGRDTLAYLPNPIGKDGVIVNGAVLGRPGTWPEPFHTGARWAVAPDGTIGIVWPSPYRVELIPHGRARIRGPVVSYRPMRVTDEHRDTWRASQQQPVAGVGRDGRPVTVRLPFKEPSNWPTHLPPYVREAQVLFSGSGHLWIEQLYLPGDNQTYDVFDGAARLIGRVRLPTGRRLVGFGRESLYLVHTPDDELEHLERYRMPRLE